MVCIKQGFHVPQGQRTQNLELGKMGLRLKVGRKHHCVAKRSFDSPALTTGWRRGYTGGNV